MKKGDYLGMVLVTVLGFIFAMSRIFIRVFVRISVIVPVLLLQLGLPAAVHGQERNVVSIVLASFSSRQNAESAVAQYERKLGTPVSGDPLLINEVQVKAKTWYRVLTQPTANLRWADQTLASLKTGAAPGAWLLRATEHVPDGQQVSVSAPQRLAAPANDETPLFDVSKDRATQVAGIKSSGFGKTAPSETIRVKTPTETVSLPLKSGQITLDGKLDESAWADTPVFDKLYILDPDTLGEPRYRTEVKIFYTDEGLYVGTKNEQPVDTLLPRLSSRDKYINRDGVAFTLDTSGEGLYGLWFEINLGGSLVDGVVLPEKQYSTEWDGPWRGESAVTENGYSTEMFLPWSMMAMPDKVGDRAMGIYFSRKVAHIDERWGYPALPMTGSKMMSALQPVEMKDVEPRQQFAVFPFAASSYDNIEDDTNYRVGADIFWRPNTNLQLTATLNPDFGAVESDDVVVNLTATETFFPEKRLFFLEGGEIFTTTPRSRPFSPGSGNFSSGARRSKSSFQPEPTTLVNTRRIGGPAVDPEVDGVTIPDVQLGSPTELMGAVKVTGQQGAFRYGVLGAAEEDTRFKGTDDITGERVLVEQTGRDFGILRFLYENVNKGRKSIGWMSTMVGHESQDAYVHGVDLHAQSQNRQWNWDAQFMHSDVGDEKGYGGFWDLSYIPKRGVRHQLSFDYLDENLDIRDLGFIRRVDTISLRYMMNITKSDLKKLRSLSNSVIMSQEYNTEGRVTRSGLFWRSTYTFFNRSAINTQFAFFPKRWDDLNSEGNGSYKMGERVVAEVGFGTDSSKKLSLSLTGSVQKEEIEGWNYDVKSGITFKPNDRFSFDLDINYRERDGWVVHRAGRNFTGYEATFWEPQISMDMFLTAKQQLRFTMQWIGIKAYDEQFYQIPIGDGPFEERVRAPDAVSEDFSISRITTQFRYRWEIAPLSDLFVVYTRGSNLVVQRDEFGDLFHDALTDPIIDFFVVKLRYRFGN